MMHCQQPFICKNLISMPNFLFGSFVYLDEVFLNFVILPDVFITFYLKIQIILFSLLFYFKETITLRLVCLVFLLALMYQD